MTKTITVRTRGRIEMGDKSLIHEDEIINVEEDFYDKYQEFLEIVKPIKNASTTLSLAGDAKVDDDNDDDSIKKESGSSTISKPSAKTTAKPTTASKPDSSKDKDI